MTPKLTDAGKNLLLRALNGETINFTKLQLGNGSAQNPTTATGLRNPLVTVPYSQITVGDEYVTLVATFNNNGITNGFHITEVGFFAEDPDDNTQEILYALGNESESIADYVPDRSSRMLEMRFDALIFIGDAENVSAAISSSLVYATKQEFDGHCADENNPHNVTAAQVGLGNVPNVTTNEQTPTYTTSVSFSNIVSGETLSTAFGKIKTAIQNLINHIANRNNPHNVTAAQTGAAALSHVHSISDITSGILGVARGGTGASTSGGLRAAVTPVYGSYTGDGTNKRAISLGFAPKIVLAFVSSESSGVRETFVAFPGKNAFNGFSGNQLGYVDWNDDASLLACSNSGFYVGGTANSIYTIYHYIAFGG